MFFALILVDKLDINIWLLHQSNSQFVRKISFKIKNEI